MVRLKDSQGLVKKALKENNELSPIEDNLNRLYTMPYYKFKNVKLSNFLEFEGFFCVFSIMHIQCNYKVFTKERGTFE